MRITLIAMGTRGDVQPYVALGMGLVAAGHNVRILTHTNFETLARSHGLEFWPASGNVQEVVESPEMRDLIEKGNFLAINARTAELAKTVVVQWARDGLAACEGADLLIAGLGGLNVAVALAEKLELPLVQAYLAPMTPTATMANPLFAGMPTWLGAGFNRISYQLARQIMWQSFRAADSLARKSVLGLAPTPMFGPYGSRLLRESPVLYGYSPTVLPKPADWGEAVHVTGYWGLDEAAAWTPLPQLEEFLNSGAPPVYIGFGSMSNRNPEETVALVLRAVSQVGVRAVLATGWGGLRRDDLPHTVFAVDAIPHSWLFPRMAAVVHHGGAGTTGAGLTAGIPSIIIPFFGDQPFWGKRVAELGVGPAPIPRKDLSVERLATALTQAVRDHAMRGRANVLGQRIRAENGIENAVTVIERYH